MSFAMQEFQDLINSLFKLPWVRYAAVIDSHGERFIGGMKPGVRSITSMPSEKKLEVQSMLILQMAQDYEPECGRLYYTAIRWDKIVALFFLLSPDWALNLTVSDNLSLQDAFEIERMVRAWRTENL